MNIKDIIRHGTLTEKKVQEPVGVQHCLNCGADYEGAYCPHCGQYWKVKRITARNIFDSFISNIAGFEANLPRTLIDLFYRPGYLTAEYIDGKRKIYTNPFSTILLLATVFIFLNQYVVDTDIREVSNHFSHSISASAVNPDPETVDFTQDITQQISNSIYNNFGLFNLTIIPVLTLPFWLAYRRRGRYHDRPLNIYEATVTMAFYTCANTMVSLISLPFTNNDTIVEITIVGYVILILLFAAVVIQMFDMRFKELFWSTVLFLIYFSIFTFGLFIVFSVIVGVWIALHGQI